MDETEFLREELSHYSSEKERIRSVIGQIGGTARKRGLDRTVSIVFLVAVVVLFALALIRDVFNLTVIPIPDMLSLELALLLVSLKIVWMIRSQTKVDHFQFWMLTSIEFQINRISQRIQRIEGKSRPSDA